MNLNTYEKNIIRFLKTNPHTKPKDLFSSLDPKDKKGLQYERALSGLVKDSVVILTKYRKLKINIEKPDVIINNSAEKIIKFLKKNKKPIQVSLLKKLVDPKDEYTKNEFSQSLRKLWYENMIIIDIKWKVKLMKEGS